MDYSKNHIANITISPESGKLDVSTWVDSSGYATIELGSTMTIRLDSHDFSKLAQVIESTREALINRVAREKVDAQKESARAAALCAPNLYFSERSEQQSINPFDSVKFVRNSSS